MTEYRIRKKSPAKSAHKSAKTFKSEQTTPNPKKILETINFQPNSESDTSPTQEKVTSQEEISPIPNKEKSHIIDNKVANRSQVKIPFKISGYKTEGKEIKFLVAWKAREDGSVPDPSYMTAEELRGNYPDLLFDYYAVSFRKLVIIEKVLINDFSDLYNGILQNKI